MLATLIETPSDFHRRYFGISGVLKATEVNFKTQHMVQRTTRKGSRGCYPALHDDNPNPTAHVRCTTTKSTDDIPVFTDGLDWADFCDSKKRSKAASRVSSFLDRRCTRLIGSFTLGSACLTLSVRYLNTAP